jgi:hypothetical protein
VVHCRRKWRNEWSERRSYRKGGREMESIALTIKFALFYAMEVFVVAVLGAAVIAGLYQAIGNRIAAGRALESAPAER